MPEFLQLRLWKNGIQGLRNCLPLDSLNGGIELTRLFESESAPCALCRLLAAFVAELLTDWVSALVAEMEVGSEAALVAGV